MADDRLAVGPGSGSCPRRAGQGTDRGGAVRGGTARVRREATLRRGVEGDAGRVGHLVVGLGRGSDHLTGADPLPEFDRMVWRLASWWSWARSSLTATHSRVQATLVKAEARGEAAATHEARD